MREVWSAVNLPDRARHRDRMIFGIGSLVSLAIFVIVFGANTGIGGDSPIYLAMSEGIFSGRGFQIDGNPTATYPPIYPVFLAILNGIGLDPKVWIAVFQALLCGLTAVATARVGDRLFSPPVGIVSGLVVATAPQMGFWSAYLLSDVLGVTFLTWGVERLVTACATEERGRELVEKSVSGGGDCERSPTRTRLPFIQVGEAGALGGLSALTRPLLLSLFLPALAWALIFWPSRALKRLGMVATALVIASAVILPWSLRNAAEFGGFYPLSTRNGWQLLQAAQWNLEGRGTTNVDVFYPDEASGLPEGEADKLVMRMAIAKISSDPVDFIRRGGLKVAFLWLPTAPGLGFGSLVTGIHFEFVALLALVALVALRSRTVLLPWGMALGGSLGVFMTILDPDYRYRLPILVALVPASGAGLVWLARSIEKRRKTTRSSAD